MSCLRPRVGLGRYEQTEKSVADSSKESLSTESYLDALNASPALFPIPRTTSPDASQAPLRQLALPSQASQAVLAPGQSQLHWQSQSQLQSQLHSQSQSLSQSQSQGPYRQQQQQLYGAQQAQAPGASLFPLPTGGAAFVFGSGATTGTPAVPFRGPFGSHQESAQGPSLFGRAPASPFGMSTVPQEASSQPPAPSSSWSFSGSSLIPQTPSFLSPDSWHAADSWRPAGAQGPRLGALLEESAQAGNFLDRARLLECCHYIAEVRTLCSILTLCTWHARPFCCRGHGLSELEGSV